MGSRARAAEVARQEAGCKGARGGSTAQHSTAQWHCLAKLCSFPTNSGVWRVRPTCVLGAALARHALHLAIAVQEGQHAVPVVLLGVGAVHSRAA